VVHAGEGRFRTYAETWDWEEPEWGVSYECKG
jgi:hypothetical protein